MGQGRAADKKRTKPGQQRRGHSRAADLPIPIVGVGASAGGLEAFTELLRYLPDNTGMGVVFIQHLAPQHTSMLAEVLSRATKLPVAEVTDGRQVEPNHVYVIPPNSNIAISGAHLRLMTRDTHAGQPLPIDAFFTSLADDRKDRAIGVVLSGTGSDGTLGLRAIKVEGGYTFAQDESAKFDSMPKSAVAAGSVDGAMSPKFIARELERISRHPYVAPPPQGHEAKELALPEDDLGKIFLWLRAASGVDFSHYKRATVTRRIKRRMVLRNSASLTDYVERLKSNRAELDALYQDMLISVTRFFRDTETFEILQREVFPQLLRSRSPDAPLRVWVPACSTGEEAYSLAICVLEFLQSAGSPAGVQIFATDISDPALEKARAGRYTDSEAAEGGPQRWNRFFTKTEGGYQVNKAVRDLCVFARQNIIHDPPFSRLDIISCRNLLIYLDASLQKKLIPIFHYALLPTGYLVLGQSEGANEFSDLFSLVDRNGRIFVKKPKAVENHAHSALTEWATLHPRSVALPPPASRTFDLHKEVSRVLLADYTPPGVLVNDDLEIVQFYGHTGPYLDPAAGAATLRLLKLAREGLPLELRTALHQAREGNKTVIKEGIRVGSGEQARKIVIEVRPLRSDELQRRHFLVLFRETMPSTKPLPSTPEEAETAQTTEILALTQQLDQHKIELQEMIEQFALRNEELQTANEEIQSNNEELQSTNEELETAKEELQATNEELTTLNDELRTRNHELSVSNSDLTNVIANVDVPIVILGGDLRIRRFNPSAAVILKLIPADVGRPITDLRSTRDLPGLETMISDSLQSKSSVEQDVQNSEGRWHRLRIRPYKLNEEHIEGAVLTLVDITEVKAEAIQARAYLEAIVGTMRDSMLVVDAEMKVKAANRAYFETFLASREATIGRDIRNLGNGQWNIPALLQQLRDILPRQTEIKAFQVEHDFPSIGRRTMQLNACPVLPDHGAASLILLAIEDITERKRAMERLEEQSKLIDLAHDAIIVRDAKSAVKSWNHGAIALYGWSKQEATGKVTHDLLKTQFPEPANVVQRKLMGSGEWSGELVHTTRAGIQVIVSSRQLTQRDDHGEPIAVLEINRDITQRRQAEAALQSSEARLRALVNSLDDVVFEVDENGRCLTGLTANPRALARIKKKRPEFKIEDFLPWKSSAPLRDALRKAVATDSAENVEYALDLPDGKRWFVARINRIVGQKTPTRTVSVFVRDITARKEVQLALERSEERFRLLVEGVRDYAIFALDTAGRVAGWNAGAERIKGYRREEILGKHLSIFYPPEEVAAGRPQHNLEIAATQGQFEEVGTWRVRKDGTRFFATVLISAIRDDEGRLRGFTKITRDITDRKRAEDSIRQLSGHILRLQDEERRRIARDLHDSTAQILAALSLNLSLASKRPNVASDPQAVKLLLESEELASQASAEVRSTSHLLHPPDLDEVGLGGAIRWYAARFSEKTGISVTIKMPDDLCRLPQENEIALFRVAQESLTNVQRHSGSKSVRVRILQHDEIVVLTIEDRGRGIDPSILANKSGGMERLGVGIAGMRERLKQLGGQLAIVSSRQGTKIEATVPCPPEPAPKKPPAPTKRRKKTRRSSSR